MKDWAPVIWCKKYITKERIQGWIAWDPLKTLSKPFRKYTFGFRTGTKFHEALDKSSDTTLKEATVASLKDTAKSTGSIYASKTVFSVVKVAFLESALGTALMSSALFSSISSGISVVVLALSKTALGVLYTTFSATITLSITTIATTLLTFVMGTQVGKFFSSTPVGNFIFQVVKKVVPVVASIIPLVMTTMVIGYLFKRCKKKYFPGEDVGNLEEESSSG